jgi:uncharacterized protein
MSELISTGVLDLLIIQPTPFCNLDCDYCYLPFRQSKQRITPEILEQIFRRAFESSIVGDHFTVVWHAGEPLVLPIAFYRDALALIAKYDTRSVDVSHSFQTNGTLITPEWCNFIREHSLRIGVSVDGPAFLHDRHRKTRAGGDTWSRVIRGIATLREHEIPFHVITVLTADSLDHADEIFEFYVEHGIRQIGFNVEEIEGINRSSSLLGEQMCERFGEFMGRFYDLVERSSEPFMVREFQSATSAIMSGGLMPNAKGHQTTPFAIISVDCQGNFSTFSPELLGLTSPEYGDFTFGNVMTDSFDSVLSKPKFMAVARDIARGIEGCRETCEYFAYCGGGAPVNKYFENGTFDSTETMFCRLSKQVILNVVLEKLEVKAASLSAKTVPVDRTGRK